MLTTSNMALNVWDDLDDPYDHDQLAANWIAVDSHDHSSGKGVQIPTGGLANLSVTTAKLADVSVTTGKIAVDGVQTANIQNGAVTGDKLDQGIFPGVLPLGAVISWYRPDNSFSVPTGWVLCVGGTLTSGNHDWGSFSITVPDLTNRFIQGVATGVNELTTGGLNTRNFNHTHTIPDHTHNTPSHTHSLPSHQHVVNSHAHAISSDGTHSHTYAGGLSTHQRPYEISSGGTPRQAMYVSGYNSGSSDDQVAMDTSGAHTHGGSTGSSNPDTSAVTGTTNSGGGSLATTGVNGGPPDTNSATISSDMRPAYFGMLFIMKVRNRT